MLPHAHAHAVLVIIPDAAAGVLAAVGVDARLEAETVDVVDQPLESVREALRMRLQVALLVTSAEEAVVRVDVDVADLVETELDDHVRGLLDDVLADVHAIGVPRAPAHRRRLHGEQAGDNGEKRKCKDAELVHFRFYHGPLSLIHC